MSKQHEVSCIVVMTTDGRLYARHFRTSISSETGISVLRFAHRKICTPLPVVRDQFDAHRLRGDNGLHRFACTGLCGGVTAGVCPGVETGSAIQCPRQGRHGECAAWSVGDLHRLADPEFGRIKRYLEMMVHIFRHAGLSVTGIP